MNRAQGIYNLTTIEEGLLIGNNNNNFIYPYLLIYTQINYKK